MCDKPASAREARARHQQAKEKVVANGKVAKAHINLAAQPRRRLQWLWQRAPDIGGTRRRDENESHRQQHLIELVAAIEPAVEQPFDRDAGERGSDCG